MKYKVTVCIPVYNMDQYLEECIISLVNQTLKEIELIFVNDGSTDRSLEILNRYAKKYSRINVVSQKNIGLGGARNAALNIAKGEYIGFVDADDFVDLKMYEKMYDTAVAQNAEMVISNVSLIPKSKNGRKKWFNRYEGYVDANFLHKNTQPWNKIVLNSVVRKNNFQFYEKNGDGQYILLMLYAKKIVSINDELYSYRVGHSSMSTNFSIDSFLISIKSCSKQIELLENTKYRIKLKEYFEFRMIYILLQTQSVAALKNNRIVFNECKRELSILNYRRNKYMKSLLVPEYGTIKYFGMTRLMGIDLRLSRILVIGLLKLGKF